MGVANGRMYDPGAGMFLSPDPYIQAPDNWLNYNRYSYCLNNPFLYTDPSGEAFLPFLFVFSANYLFNGLTTSNWGWSNVGQSALATLSFAISGNPATMPNAGQFVANNMLNSGINKLIPSMNIPIGKHFGLSMGSAFRFGSTGMNFGVNMGASLKFEGLEFGFGFGGGNGYDAWNASTAFKGYGYGWGKTYYDESKVLGQKFGSQVVGNKTIYFNYNSFSISNDLWGDTEDRWRTNAAELTVGKWSVGTSLYTNWGEEASKDSNGNSLMNESENCIPPWPVGQNKNDGLSTWANGRVYFAPMWIGYRKGNQVTRYGLSHKIIHNLTQNWVHKYFGKQNYYMHYDEFRGGGSYSTGGNNPFSLWDH